MTFENEAMPHSFTEAPSGMRQFRQIPGSTDDTLFGKEVSNAYRCHGPPDASHAGYPL
ncbi:hypothetical protein D3C81_2341610 [compost metagenome]